MLKPGCLTCKLSVCSLCEGWQFRCHLHLHLEQRVPHALYVMQVQTVSGKKHGVSPDFTLAHMTQLIMPQHANSLGITFGGQVCHAYPLFCSTLLC